MSWMSACGRALEPALQAALQDIQQFAQGAHPASCCMLDAAGAVAAIGLCCRAPSTGRARLAQLAGDCHRAPAVRLRKQGRNLRRHDA